MIQRVLQYIRGYLRIRITGYSTERFLNLCSNKHIYLWGLEHKNHGYEMCISIKEFRKLKSILKKTGTKVSIVERFGLPFFLHRYRKRKLFFLGSLLCVSMIYVLTLFIWDIRINGNFTITDETMVEFLKKEKVYHGMMKSKVQCDKIATVIRKQYDEIIWVSASLEGTRLVIDVKENSDTINPSVPSIEATDIIASKNGTILRMVTRKGIPLVSQGTQVKKGDLLVDGCVEVLDDSGEVKDYKYQNSDADILAETVIKYEDELPFVYEEKEYTKKQRKGFWIRVGDHYFRIGFLKNSYKNQEQYTNENRVCLGEHFYLPISYGSTCIKEYKTKAKKHTEKEAQHILSTRFLEYCDDLKNDNKEILKHNVKIFLTENGYLAKGEIKVIEDIGKHRAINIDFHKDSMIE